MKRYENKERDIDVHLQNRKYSLMNEMNLVFFFSFFLNKKGERGVIAEKR